MAFKPDGTVLYITGTTVVGTLTVIQQWTLSTAWDITSATYSAQKDIGTNTPNVLGQPVFAPNGARVIFTNSGPTNPQKVTAYSISTAWDISTAAYLDFLDVSAETTLFVDVDFSEDGLTMWLGTLRDDIGNDLIGVLQYTLTGGFNVSSATFASKSKDITSQVSTFYQCMTIF
jgi:hypothetical protein